MQKSSSPANSGTISGNPPTLEWIATSALSVDPIYQRETAGPQSKRLIAAMARLWDWRLCMPLVVSRRADGAMLVIDGQHRLLGAQANGGVPHLPCVISNFADGAAEADAFVQLNTRRQALTQYDIFRASLASGNPDARIIADLIAAAGLTHTNTNNTDQWKPRDIFCGPFLQRQLGAFGADIIGRALHAIASAYPDKPCTSGRTLIGALLFFYRDGLPDNFDQDIFIRAMAEVDPPLWFDEARLIQIQNPVFSRTECWTEALHNAYDDYRGHQND